MLAKIVIFSNTLLFKYFSLNVYGFEENLDSTNKFN